MTTIWFVDVCVYMTCAAVNCKWCLWAVSVAIRALLSFVRTWGTLGNHSNKPWTSYLGFLQVGVGGLFGLMIAEESVGATVVVWPHVIGDSTADSWYWIPSFLWCLWGSPAPWLSFQNKSAKCAVDVTSLICINSIFSNLYIPKMRGI